MKKYLFIIFLLAFVWVAVSSPTNAVDPVTTITPKPTTDPDAFVIPPFPTPEIPTPVKFCELKSSRDETIYPPNSACYAEVKRTQLKIKDYPKTCIKEPIVTYNDIRKINESTASIGDNSFKNCGNPPRDLVYSCNVYVTVTTDVSKAELGSYGPNYETLASTTPNTADNIAKKYLFNSLFDRPYYDIPNTPREAWRTYWRLLPFKEQANLTAQFINLVNLNPIVDKLTLKKINNTKYQYIDANGGINTTTVKDLMNQLPQCLLTEPVCDDFAVEYNNLNANTKAAYNTLIPLSFNNLRGWIALVPPKWPGREPLPDTVSRESLPYIEPIFSGLLSSKYGLLANLQPSWLIADSLSDLTDKNTSYDISILSKDGYISGQFAPGDNKFEDNDMDVTVTDNADVVRCPDYPDIYHLSAPYTYPKNPQNKDPYHVQEVQILGSTIKWTLDESPALVEDILDRWGNKIGERLYCNDPDQFCSESPLNGSDVNCCHFKVSGSGIGKALTVFNNPKVTDIKQTVVGNTETSLYNTLIPDALLTPTPTDKKIDAPIATHLNIKTDYSGNSAVTNKDNPIYRENNLAQDTVHIIQNCWLVPSDNQKSTKCGLAQPFECSTDCDPGVPSATTALATKAKFIELANQWLAGVGNPAIDKFETVVNSASAAGVNPIFALAIWLHETAASNYEGICKQIGGGDMDSGYCTRVLDFGINLDSIASNYSTGEYHFADQLRIFLELPNRYKNTCRTEMTKYRDCPMRVFTAMYFDGKCEPSTRSDAYINAIKSIFNSLAPDQKFPCYPSAYP
ncbi:MAG TPA: hypothetical protein VLH94_01120 [Spirochaetia bacterium]|nr:hypothetical protein [Spirochaetia bacterium]